MVFSRFRGRDTQVGPPLYTLTEAGREKSETFSQDPRARILTAMSEKGPSTPQDISKATGMRENYIRHMLKRMEGRFVTRTGTGGY